MISFLDILGNISDITVIILGGGIFAVLLLILVSLDVIGGDDQRMRQRIDQIVDPRTRQSDSSKATPESLRRNTSDSTIVAVDRLIKGLLPNVTLMRQRLERSGWPLRIGDYLLVCAGL